MIDIGANLTNQAFRRDLGAVLERARAAGVDKLVVTGTSIAASRDALALAERHRGTVYATAGVHPHDAKTCDGETLDSLAELARHPAVVAIGECGLDFDRDFSPREVQREWFEQQVQLAARLGMPLFLHERDASADLLRVLTAQRDRITRAVVHCFTGTREELHAYLDLDLHIGITGWICDERRGTHLAQLVREIPLERMMIETDSPYLLPRTIRPKPKGRRNEPAFLTWVRDAIAAARGVAPEEIDVATSRTAGRFFGLG